MGWLAEGVRCTAFFAPGDDPCIDWERRFGVPPESVTDRPQQKLKQVQGKIGTADLRAKIIGDRIDWIWAMPGGPRPINVGFDDRFIGAFETVIDEFNGIILKWLFDQSIIRRIAFGCLLAMPAGTPTEASLVLQPFIPHFKIPDKSPADFSVQVNRPRPSSVVRDLSINRLSRWSITEMVTMDVAIVGGGASQGEPKVTKGSEAHLEVDFNTALREAAFSVDMVVPIWQELVGFATKITQSGDCE